MRVAASKIRYQGTRASQEDFVSLFSIRNQGHVAVGGVLTDGIGGLPGGGRASATVNAFSRTWLADELAAVVEGDADIASCLRRLPPAADEALACYQSDSDTPDCGTTLVAAVILDDVCHFVSVGDSLVLAINADHTLARLNHVHNAERHGRLALTSAILGRGINAVDQGRVSLSPRGNHSILLASDGIRTLRDDEIVAELGHASEGPLRQVVDRVRAKRAASQDNLAMALFRVVAVGA